jgi:hypothetical protein
VISKKISVYSVAYCKERRGARRSCFLFPRLPTLGTRHQYVSNAGTNRNCGIEALAVAIIVIMHLCPFSVSAQELDIDVETRNLLTNALLIKPVPFVRRVLFIATPHRGSYQALGLLVNLASRLVNLPGRFTKLSFDLLTLQRKGLLPGPMSGVPTSIDNMNPTNRFIVALSTIPIADGVVANCRRIAGKAARRSHGAALSGHCHIGDAERYSRCRNTGLFRGRNHDVCGDHGVCEFCHRSGLERAFIEFCRPRLHDRLAADQGR